MPRPLNPRELDPANEKFFTHLGMHAAQYPWLKHEEGFLQSGLTYIRVGRVALQLTDKGVAPLMFDEHEAKPGSYAEISLGHSLTEEQPAVNLQLHELDPTNVDRIRRLRVAGFLFATAFEEYWVSQSVLPEIKDLHREVAKPAPSDIFLSEEKRGVIRQGLEYIKSLEDLHSTAEDNLFDAETTFTTSKAARITLRHDYVKFSARVPGAARAALNWTNT